MTTEKPTKSNGDPKTRQKHPKKELDAKKKKSKNHEFPPKTTLNSPDLLQIPQSTTIYLYNQREPNETQWRPQNSTKPPPNQPRTTKKKQNAMISPQKALKST